ncbi:MAG TPA: hypothetical protein VHH53_13005, partial [Pseudonocardiaceae bacterium]|nr:hypothetical protein [Pseudonocardiaceae bacterium]
ARPAHDIARSTIGKMRYVTVLPDVNALINAIVVRGPQTVYAAEQREPCRVVDLVLERIASTRKRTL